MLLPRPPPKADGRFADARPITSGKLVRLNNSPETAGPPTRTARARAWPQILARYRQPSPGRSIFEIVVTIVPTNALMMSVEAPTEQEKPFVLSIDATFLGTLTDDEIEAAIAHELGHVWIFTHHPYLQTEELANQIAMRAVSRGVLERLYAKVWERGGTKGDLARFLGEPPAAKPAAAGLAADSAAH